jgi:hypothetical protein
MRRGFLGAVALAALALTFVLGGTAAGSPLAKPSPIKNCPSNPTGYLPADNVDAYYTGSGPFTYWFDSLQDESPVNGVPGLVGYCVYTDGTVSDATATYDKYGQWKSDYSDGNFSFVRPNGEKSNIPLDGTTGIEVGTATFSGDAPTTQTILLHISDTSVCQDIYGGDATTCYVYPTQGPICNAADPNDTNAGYNAIPEDVVNCGPPSFGFEAQASREFGDKVQIDPTTGQITALKVSFNSYACAVSGHWNTADCISTGGPATFTHDITAKVYDPSDLTTPLATVTDTVTFPYRPDADAVKCPGGVGGGIANGSQWFNPNAVPGNECEYSAKLVHTFTFGLGSPITVPSNGQVVWTVAFNTTHYGAAPIGESALCFGTSAGCPYDSLNVSYLNYPGAPYVGLDLNNDEVFIWRQANPALAPESGWTGYRPLGEIFVQ